jgi:hypothetical protein
MPLQVLRMTTSKIIGGSVTKRGTLNSFRPNITTHFYYSTDMMGKFSRGQENYNLTLSRGNALWFFLVAKSPYVMHSSSNDQESFILCIKVSVVRKDFWTHYCRMIMLFLW